ncbi:hypothetical protein PENSPDRAFT_693008 [Peniophora sp. CONT]|nr:hypothetical protein PENSPDRAFT_693008 [Peniophora sp. CONT]
MLDRIESVDNLRLPVTNGSAMVFRLPNELLGEIAKALPPPTFAGNQFNEVSYPAFSLSHTCKEWREVVMAYPDCWRYIPCTNSHWLEEGLRRSEGALLHLYIDVSTIPAIHFTANRLARHASRVCAIIMDDFTHSEPAHYVGANRFVLMNFLMLDFPALRHATLLRWYNPTSYSFIPPTIFAGKAPLAMQDLVISDAILFSLHPLVEGPLRHLEITSTHLWLKTDAIIQLFKAPCCLEVFIARQNPDLDYMPWNADLLQPPRCIEVASLREITFVGFMHDALEAFKLLVLPVHCNIHIEDLEPPLHKLEDGYDWKRGLHDSLDVLNSHLATVPADAMMHASSHVSLSYRHFEIDYKLATEIKLSIYYVPDRASSRITSFEIVFYMSDERMGKSFHIARFCELLAPHLFSNAHTLRLELSSVCHDLPTYELWEVLAAMPSVRTLTLAGRAGEMLFVHETHNLSLCEVHANLRTLTLSRLDFGNSLTAEKLVMALQAKEGRSWSLEALDLEDCIGFSPNDKEDLHTLESKGVSIEHTSVDDVSRSNE